MLKTANPQLKWAQRKDKIFITFDIVEVENPKIEILGDRILKFSGFNKNHIYKLELDLYEEISKEDSKYVFATRNIFLNLKKKIKGPYWPRLNNSLAKLNFVNIDWKHFVDEDEEDENTRSPNFASYGEEKCFPEICYDKECDEELSQNPKNYENFGIGNEYKEKFKCKEDDVPPFANKDSEKGRDDDIEIRNLDNQN